MVESRRCDVDRTYPRRKTRENEPQAHECCSGEAHEVQVASTGEEQADKNAPTPRKAAAYRANERGHGILSLAVNDIAFI